MARRVFYSFHYDNDSWRTSQVRNIGVIEGNRPAPDNDWEAVKKGGDPAIKRWIDNQMYGRSCTIVLVGSNTAGRKWIEYEIKKSWEEGMGVVGIRIHNLKNYAQQQSYWGNNPFALSANGIWLEDKISLHNPPYVDSKDVYNYIADNIGNWTEEAVRNRNRY
ncbi:MAG TPA: TIR domain-containing protein [Flavobacteriales bacterium]|nr:TIR domain-containing protein [Flavobacteriales bacterium]